MGSSVKSSLVGAALSVCPIAFGALSTPALLDRYDVVWTTPSENSAGSMPIGNGELVINAWVERTTGDIVLLLARSDAMSEISRVMKLGRIRVHFSSNPFRDRSSFAQRLHLRDGKITFASDAGQLALFVDSEAHVAHLTGSLKVAAKVTATVECWRNVARALPKNEMDSAWSAGDAPFPLLESADQFVSSETKSVTWYHRNFESVVPKLWANQSLTGLPGVFDPLVNLTFGGRLEGANFVASGACAIATERAVRRVDLRVSTFTAQTQTPQEWIEGVAKVAKRSSVAETAAKRTQAWWHSFWGRSWVFVDGDEQSSGVPLNAHPLRIGIDSNGGNRFPGLIYGLKLIPEALGARQIATSKLDGAGLPANGLLPKGFTLIAEIQPDQLQPGRVFDKVTAGAEDGFLFDTHPGDSLRLIVGQMQLSAPKCLVKGKRQRVAATFNASTGEAVIYLDGKVVARRPGEKGSSVTRGYVLQRYAQACQSRGKYPVKFNGGFITVEPEAMGMPYDPDWRRWGDSHWFQNVRHMFHPMMASGDFEMTEPFFRMYESVRPLAESRTKLYHGVEGAYFPETMSLFGTYAGKDYGWNRQGKKPSEVDSPWWRYAWNQGPELVALMLDRWDYTQDQTFLKSRVLPMAESVLRYFDTRFRKDAAGHIVIDPAQSVETYWEGVVNDTPTVSGLIAITERLGRLPNSVTTAKQRAFFTRMQKACPALPIRTLPGGTELSYAEKFVDKTTNCENPELYAVWPSRVVSLAHPLWIDAAKRSYEHRKNHLDNGWGYDGNVAALLGMTDEAARILKVKCQNSNPAFRWPATWGPNFDWLPDQNHGGNLLNTTNLMLLQCEPIEAGGAIRLLPAWPKNWNVDFLLHAPGNTTVHCMAKQGRIQVLEVSPADRRKDVVLPHGW